MILHADFDAVLVGVFGKYKEVYGAVSDLYFAFFGHGDPLLPVVFYFI